MPASPPVFITVESAAVCFPASCACCDGPVEGTLGLPVSRGIDLFAVALTRTFEVAMPVCGACQRRLMARRIALWVAAASAWIAPLVALLACGPLAAVGQLPWGNAAMAAAVAWTMGGLWWLRNRAAQSFTRRVCPAWIEDASDDLSELTLGFRRPTLARDVASLSGAAPWLTADETAGYRDPGARAPEAYRPPPPRPLAWWWPLLLGALFIAGGVLEYVDLAERERLGLPIRQPAVFALVYALFGKVGVAGVMVLAGAAMLAVAVKLRRLRDAERGPE